MLGEDPATWSPSGATFGDNDEFDEMNEIVEEEPMSEEPIYGRDPATWSPNSRSQDDSTDNLLNSLTISDLGKYRVQDCPSYLSDVFENDEEAEALFSPIL